MSKRNLALATAALGMVLAFNGRAVLKEHEAQEKPKPKTLTEVLNQSAGGCSAKVDETVSMCSAEEPKESSNTLPWIEVVGGSLLLIGSTVALVRTPKPI